MKRAHHRGLLSLEELSRLTGKAYRTCRARLERVEPARRTAKAILYAPAPALAAIFAADRPPAIRNDVRLADLKHRKLQLEIEDLELDVGQKRRELVAIETAVTVVATQYSACRARLLAIPTKMAPLVVTTLDVDRVRRTLEEAIEEALAELSTDTLVARCA